MISSFTNNGKHIYTKQQSDNRKDVIITIFNRGITTDQCSQVNGGFFSQSPDSPCDVFDELTTPFRHLIVIVCRVFSTVFTDHPYERRSAKHISEILLLESIMLSRRYQTFLGYPLTIAACVVRVIHLLTLVT